jgi:hypothetical protein
VQARPLGDLGQGDEPDAAQLNGQRFGRLQQVFRAPRLVLGRPGPLAHPHSLTHPMMREPDLHATVEITHHEVR